MSFQYLQISIWFVSSAPHEGDYEKLEMLQVSILTVILASTMRQCVLCGKSFRTHE